MTRAGTAERCESDELDQSQKKEKAVCQWNGDGDGSGYRRRYLFLAFIPFVV